MTRSGLTVIATTALLIALSACAGSPHPTVVAELKARTPHEPRISDAAFTRQVRRKLERLAGDDDAVDVSILQKQLKRRKAPVPALQLLTSDVPGEAPTGPELYSQLLPSVVSVSERYLCGKCDKWHIKGASGFAIADGIVVTNHHVVQSGESGVMAAFDHRGTSFPIAEVLVADADADLAVLRLGGEGPFPPPLPIASDIEIGADVFVLSHPDSHYFYFSRGILARKIESSRNAGPQFEITADFARGSSGGPVVDANGRVIGVVVATDSVYYDSKEETNLQMVFKKVIPAGRIIKLLGQ